MSFNFLSINSYGSLRDLELLVVFFLKGNVVKITTVSPSGRPKQWWLSLFVLINRLIKMDMP